MALQAWPGQIFDLRPPGTAAGLPFSGAYADFVAFLSEIEKRDQNGPLGQAVRESRYAGADSRKVGTPFLSGEAKRPTGFPVVLDVTGGRLPEHLCKSAWVELADKWPDWLTEAGIAEPSGRAAEGKRLWDELTKVVAKALGKSNDENFHLPGVLPEWYLVYLTRCDEVRLESAGLALALQALADEQGWPIPAGVGFTGRWDAGGLLAGVSGIARKLQAAREAGIFALFACVRPEEVPTEADVKGEGVDLFLLPEGLNLEEVVRLVNTACAARGLTEDRWRWVSEKQQVGFQPEGENLGVTSRLLPCAAVACRFVGRKQEQGKLTDWKSKAETQPERRLAVLEGSLRAGKTTLLSHWLGQWPRLPLWFSFLRDDPRANSLGNLKTALDQQLQARYRVLDFPRAEKHRQRNEEATWPPLVQSVIEATDAPIHFVVDGLDEAQSQEQKDILTLLRTLPGRGVGFIGAQLGTPCLGNFDEANRVRLTPCADEDQSAAKELIRRFIAKFQESQKNELVRFGEKLASDQETQVFIRKHNANLWFLTDSLTSILDGYAEPPDNLSDLPDLPRSETVEKYCKHVLGQIMKSYRDERRTGCLLLPAVSIFSQIMKFYVTERRTEAEQFLRTIAVVDVDDRDTPWRAGRARRPPCRYCSSWPRR